MKKKTLMSLAAAAAIAVSSAGITANGEASPFLIGDVNGDGTVDAVDASSVLAAYASKSSGKESPLYSYQESAADLNGDGVVDAIDASLILSYYAFASVSDEGAIFADFLEQNGLQQRETPEEEKPNETPAEVPAPAVQEQTPILGGFEFTAPHIDSEYGEWFWVGDSRTVGLAMNINIDYIAKVGATIRLFRENADAIYALREKTVIINLGVNDLDSNAYINLYNSMPDEFLDNNKVIVMAVNPCNGSYQYLNSRIEAFNAAVSSALDPRITFLDTYSYLNWGGFSTRDGLHYSNDTYINLYNFVMDSVN
ncbi:MAG: hypothetical protein IKH78_08540 [Ruminococcus sp.]|nr:hypothetical protein [Ruminococcus sp.]